MVDMKNKKFITCLAGAVFALSSCVTTNKTAKTVDFTSGTYNATVADLDVAETRVSETLDPVPAEVRRGGMNNIKKTVEAMALEKNGNADVLVNPEFTYTVERGLFSKKVTSITVTGHPAKYKNFRSLNDSVWSNPVFRGVRVKGHSPYKPHSRGIKSFFAGKAEANYEGTTNYRKGFTWGMDFAGSYEFGNEKWAPAAMLNLGYHINPYLYIGVGSGVEWDISPEYGFIPVYGNVRAYLQNRSCAPFVDVRLGSSTEVNKSKVDGGFYGSFSIGYSFKSFDISAFFTIQKAEVTNYSYYRYDSYSYKNKEELKRIGLRIGFRL